MHLVEIRRSGQSGALTGPGVVSRGDIVNGTERAAAGDGPATRRSIVIVDPIGEELAAWGKVLIIETRGRLSGRPARAAVGFVEESSGTWLVTAGSPDADWARNLELEPAATLEVGGRRVAVVAEPLDEAAHARTVRELILRYGTPAERLGLGASFRLRPAGTDQWEPAT